MDNNLNSIEKMSKEAGHERIKKLQKKLDITRYNMEISGEIIAQTASDTQQEKLTQKNIRRKHGIAGIEKEIRDIEEKLNK